MGHTHKRGNVKYTDGTSNLPGLFLANVPGKKNTNILAKWLAVFCDFVFLSVSNLPGIPGKLAFFRTGVNKDELSQLYTKKFLFVYNLGLFSLTPTRKKWILPKIFG